MSASVEKAADWLLSGLHLRSTLFHIGQYCGSYRASTAGHQSASFHLILQGECWLHVRATSGRGPTKIRLSTGDAVLLMHDVSHCLTPDADALQDEDFSVRVGQMTSPSSKEMSAGGIALACGFFEFRTDLGDAVKALLPDYIIARSDDSRFGGARAIFDLIRSEAVRATEVPSPLIARLTDVLFLYALRAVAISEEFSPGRLR